MNYWLQKIIKANPMTLFIYGIISKWYMIIAFSGLVVVYWVFKGLEETHVFRKTYAIVMPVLQDTKSIAKHCTPKIVNGWESVWECIKNPPEYEESQDEKNTQILMQKVINEGEEKGYYDTYNPYTQPQHNNPTQDNTAGNSAQ